MPSPELGFSSAGAHNPTQLGGEESLRLTERHRAWHHPGSGRLLNSPVRKDLSGLTELCKPEEQRADGPAWAPPGGPGPEALAQRALDCESEPESGLLHP